MAPKSLAETTVDRMSSSKRLRPSARGARSRALPLTLAATMAIALAIPLSAAAWEPTKPVEFIVPAGTGGGADQMARLLQGVITKNNLMKQPMIVVNKSGGAGAEGFLAVKDAKGDPHKIIITLSNLFTTPLATGVPFNWKDLTPVAMLALDQFVLWVNAEAPYKTAKDYLDAVKAGGPNKFKMGGTGSKQEDQIITVAIEKATGTKFTYIPFKGGGDVAVQLVGKHIDSSVNNPIEAVAQWRAGALRPLCVFDDDRMPYKTKVTDDDVVERHPELQGGGRGRRLPDAARHLHAGRGHEGAGRLLRRSVQESARNPRLEEVHGGRRLQHDVHDGPRVREVGRERREHAQDADEGSRASWPSRDASARRPARPHRAAPSRRRSPRACRPVRNSPQGGSMSDDKPSGDGAGISTRTMEIVVALILFAIGAIVVFDSYRLGARWGDDGPQSGYFPFYIGLLLCLSSLATLAQVALAEWKRRDQFRGAVAERRSQFVGWGPLRLVLSVLVPALVYVLGIQLIGIYVASAALHHGVHALAGQVSRGRRARRSGSASASRSS